MYIYNFYPRNNLLLIQRMQPDTTQNGLDASNTCHVIQNNSKKQKAAEMEQSVEALEKLLISMLST